MRNGLIFESHLIYIMEEPFSKQSHFKIHVFTPKTSKEMDVTLPKIAFFENTKQVYEAA